MQQNSFFPILLMETSEMQSRMLSFLSYSNFYRLFRWIVNWNEEMFSLFEQIFVFCRLGTRVKRFHFTTDWMVFSLGTIGGLYMNYSFTCCCCYGATTGLNPRNPPASCDSLGHKHTRETSYCWEDPREDKTSVTIFVSICVVIFFLHFYSGEGNVTHDVSCPVAKNLFIRCSWYVVLGE